MRGLDNALEPFGMEADPITLGRQSEAASAILGPLLVQTGAALRLLINAVPNSHLDVAWVWTVDETVR